MKKYRLLNIGEKHDFVLDRQILYVELSPIKENQLLNGYSFWESEKEVFIFLLEKIKTDYFLNQPEEIKHINLNSFQKGEFKISDSESIKVYRHENYIFEYNKLLNPDQLKKKRKEKSRGQKLAEIRNRVSKKKEK